MPPPCTETPRGGSREGGRGQGVCSSVRTRGKAATHGRSGARRAQGDVERAHFNHKQRWCKAEWQRKREEESSACLAAANAMSVPDSKRKCAGREGENV
eukprot:3935039-Rhodomonas_salina.2